MLQPRVWIEEENRMVLVEIVDFNDEAPFIQVKANFGSGVYYFDEVVFMQATTFKDVNGKDIYEGDILRTTTTDELFVVRYDLNRGWRADGNRTGVTLQDLLEGKAGYNDLVDLRLYNYKHLVEVVGNVFENTELYDENSIFEYEKRRLENES